MATIEQFIHAPSEELLEDFTKDQLLKLAAHYEIEITSSERRLKESVKEALWAIPVDGGVLENTVMKQTASSQSGSLPLPATEIKFRIRELASREKQMYLEHERFKSWSLRA